MSFELIGQIVGGLCFVVAFVLAILYVSKGSYHRGYQKGRSDAEAWIVKLETEVDQARQEIWRTEG